MDRHFAWPLRLLAAAAALCPGSGTAAAAAHTLHYFFTGVSEASSGVPRFAIVGYLDGQQFVHYDSNSRRDLPRGPWGQKLEQDDALYWEWQSQLSQSWELYFQVSLWSRFNHTPGFHTWQWSHGCELSPDGIKGGHSQFGYDGKDFLSLDKETLTWTAADWRAQVTKRRWEADRVWTQGRKNFLEGDCIEWLQKYLSYGKESLLQKEPPLGKVSRKASEEDLETLVCRLHGFYPKDVDATWRKDGEVLEHETLRGGIVPNSDGTYYTWLSIEIDPRDRDHYRCHVEHDGLLDPLDLAWEKPAAAGLLVGIVMGTLAAVLLAAGTIFCTRKWRSQYQATSDAVE